MRASQEELERLHKMPAISAEDRPPMNQEEYDAEYGGRLEKEDPVLRKIGRSLQNSYCYPFTGVQPFLHAVVSFMPILHWLPRYNFKRDLVSDMIGGFTTGIMHVPQGIAYSALAGVDPVYGLYSSCFPAFFYMFFGTSRHVSIGSFAVVALMAGVANDKVMSIHGAGTVDLMRDSYGVPYNVTTHYDVTPIQVATTLTFAIGIWQLLCALLRLQFVMAYFSDPLVSGFTTGAAVHVLLAQIDDIMGVSVPKASGIGYVFVRIYDLAVRVTQVNITTLIISILSMTFLYVGKEYLSPFLTKRISLRIPIPYELILVAVTTALSSLLNWHDNNSVAVVGNVPAGLPEPELPVFGILCDCLLQSIGIAIVIIAVHISMAKMLGKKMNYHVDDSQELYAIGLTSLLGGFFPVYPVSTALGRTMVNVKSGSQTLLSTVFSCALLMAIILWLGPLLRDLPKCVLASIIIVALKSMFMKCGELRRIYAVSKIDFMVWIVSFFSTVFVNVMEGLAISILFALFTVICRSQWPKWQYFLQNTQEEQDSERPCNNPDVCVFRFDGPLLFTNVERFRKSLNRTLEQWMKCWEENPSAEDTEKLNNSSSPNRPESLYKGGSPHFLIIDCSAMAYCDYMAATAFNEIAKDFKDKGGILYLAGANASLRTALGASGFFKKIEKEHLFPTLKDALAIASRNGNALRLLRNARKEPQVNHSLSSLAVSSPSLASASLPPTPSSPIVRLSPFPADRR
ncbi:unnamed protein product [Cylicocyclus nassatus]|uniref:STAS domain-containing protein n=1 Tax=Cylicocyclus nassatus TaxID=53992 RepID=A0AA36GMP1_CYLNA|nr:unnamed protein product [Cylicocyclus nassatus]